ncbi:MAG TPA: HNH endonuclease signature motif containing protein [Pseudobdellovibrionaceae bacterium]|nr:HNH endonuclease signature motif containing protein [Pseudobdellovibrionaceae bacterium]
MKSLFVFVLLAMTSLQVQAEFQSPFDLTEEIYFSRGSLDEELENSDYPIHPQAALTTGSLCDQPSRKRYPEGINYCERDVDTYLKKEIIRKYDTTFRYRIQSMPRSQFKIDHLIPLCAGGSNHESNLWPQYKKVYEITDPLEPELCAAMSNGRLLQKDAVVLILRAKNNLDQADSILRHIRSL